MTEKVKCTLCLGSGRRTETYTTTEHDIGMSAALGAATGTGYMPMSRTVTKTRSVICSKCGGSGEVSE